MQELSIREFSSHQLNANLLWPGTFLFADWLVKNRSILDGQRILELGRYGGYVLQFEKCSFSCCSYQFIRVWPVDPIYRTDHQRVIYVMPSVIWIKTVNRYIYVSAFFLFAVSIEACVELISCCRDLAV